MDFFNNFNIQIFRKLIFPITQNYINEETLFAIELRNVFHFTDF